MMYIYIYIYITITSIMENRMEEESVNYMETEGSWGIIGIRYELLSLFWFPRDHSGWAERSV